MVIRPLEHDNLAQLMAVHLASWRDAYAAVLPSAYLNELVAKDL